MKNAWKLAVGFAISLVALYLTLRNVRFGDLAASVASAQPVWALPAAVFFVATLHARAWRWSLLMGRAPFLTTLHAMNIGYMLNMTLPFRLGEVARAYVIGARTTISMTRALSSVVVERVLDLATVVGLFAVFAQFVPMPEAFARTAAVGGALVGVMLVCGALLVWQAEAAKRLFVAPVARRVSPKAGAFLTAKFDEVTGSFRALGTARQVAAVLLLTVWIWGTNVALTWFALRAFLPGTFQQAGLVVVTANLGGAIPSAPGGLGLVQGFASTALVVPFGVPEDKAIAFAFTWSLGQQLALIALGLYGLARIGMSLAEVRGAGRSEKASAAVPRVPGR